MIDPLAGRLGFRAALLPERFGLGDKFLQRRNVGFQGLECTAFVRLFVQVFARSRPRRRAHTRWKGCPVEKQPRVPFER